MNATAFGRDLYMRHTATDGRSVVREHRVWDAELFVAAQKSAAEGLNATAIKEASDKKLKAVPALANAEQITKDQYLKERTK